MHPYGKGDSSWFVQDRFGMFIHWGLYSMPARHEWVRHREEITDEDYQIYFELFNPDLFDPHEWARTARRAGMKYVVFTTKHHEGFCMWDTRYTDYKITNTPYGKDILREVVDAFRAEGIHIGFYYSLLDWHHPDYVLDRHVGPYRNAPNLEELNRGRDMSRYAEYMRNQVTELLTSYGKIDVLWFDFSYPCEDGSGKGCKDWESEKLIRLVRSLQPDIMVDNRLDLPGSGDIVTPEQYLPSSQLKDAEGNPVVWEGCHTMSGSWGYHRDEADFKSPRQCIDLLINHVSRGGNFLMNIGPTSRGMISVSTRERLEAYAEWMKYNSRSIYGCGVAPEEWPTPPNCRYTWNPKTKRLYVHLMDYPFKFLSLPGLAGRIRYAQFLSDGSELEVREKPLNTGLSNTELSVELPLIVLPVRMPDNGSLVQVIELVIK